MQYILKLDNNISLDNYIKDIAKGNMSALEMLYNNTRTIVFGYAFSILKNINISASVTSGPAAATNIFLKFSVTLSSKETENPNGIISNFSIFILKISPTKMWPNSWIKQNSIITKYIFNWFVK